MSHKPCPYRKEHEYGDDGICVHCFAPRPIHCDKHRFKFGGMVVNAGRAKCLWCGKLLQQALDENAGARA